MNNYLNKLAFNEIIEKLKSYCNTYIGKDIASLLVPSNKKDVVKNSLEETNEAMSLALRASFPSFMEIKPIDVSLKRLASGLILTSSQLLNLKNIFQLASNLKNYINQDFLEESTYPLLFDLFNKLYSNKSIIDSVNNAIIDENTINDKASKNLYDIRRKKRKLEQNIKEELNKLLRSKYVQESIITIRNDRFVIPVKEEYRSSVKGFVHDISNAGSTVFIEPLSVFEMNNELNELSAKEELEIDMNFVALVGMIDPARPEVKDSIRIAKQANVKTVMITGDHITTASAIAKELGILTDDKKAITSLELDQIDDETLAKTIDDYRVFARVAPKDKVRIVDAWQKNDAVVAMTGDGVNDAPALKRADIGCAMGITGTDVSKQAADMILTDDNFSTIVEAVKQGRGIYANIKKCIRFLLSSNIGEVIVIFIATIIGLFVPDVGVPLLAVQLLWVNLITDSLPAFGLGMEEPEDKVMYDKPRPKKESFFAGKIGINIMVEGIFIGLITLAAFLIGEFVFDVDNTNIHGHTMAFMTLATAELFHAYNVRTDGTIFSKETFKNKALNIAFIIGMALQFAVLYIPGLNNVVFQLAPLNIAELAIVFALAISVIVFMEIYKLIKRQIAKRNK